jgi:hypothetical protein
VRVLDERPLMASPEAAAMVIVAKMFPSVRTNVRPLPSFPLDEGSVTVKELPPELQRTSEPHSTSSVVDVTVTTGSAMRNLLA